MSNSTVGDAAIAVVRRKHRGSTRQGQLGPVRGTVRRGFRRPHAAAEHDTRQGRGAGTYKGLRAAFPDFCPEIHWQVAAGDLVTTYKTYHGPHQGEFLGIPATGKKVSFYTVDAMRVVDGKITEHWGVATLLDLMQQLGVVPPLGGQR